MNVMRNLLITAFIFLFYINSAFAYEMILPKEKKNYVSTNYAFFVGNARNGESVTINGEHITIAPNGAFAYSVKLKNGENRIAVKSDYSTRIYKFYKTSPNEVIKPELAEFDPKLYRVLTDNTPMRSNPVDYGMNRLSHLFKDTLLVINGEKNGFYRIYLSKNKTGWIAKDSVIAVEEEIEVPKFITMNSETFKNASSHTIEFSEKLPYTIDETDKEIIFKVYNPQYAENSVYTVNIRKPKKYTYKTISSNGVYVFKVNKFPIPDEDNLEGLNIVVDAGHGGSENGAIGCLGDKEKNVNLAIAQELKDILTQMGACVTMTRECDGTISLADRVSMAKENCADIFVSVHLNSIPDIPIDIHKNRGTSVYYYNHNSKELAEAVEESLTDSIKTRKDGVRTASFAVIRPTEYVGILVETAYMTNPFDSVLYKSDSFARDAAMGIANGIMSYVNGK